MAFDLNEAEQQAERKYGPVPSGSKVLLKMEFKEPNNCHPQQRLIAVSSKGLYMLWVEFTVQAGQYEGVHWNENWMLPAGMQKVAMTEGQTKACSISYSKMRAIVEAARGIMPRDTSAQANSKRKLNSILDLNGMVFPSSVGLDKGREGTDRNGNQRVFFNNVVSVIVTPDKRDYKELMDGGEWINPEGLTKRDMPAPTTGSSNADPFADVPPAGNDYAFPSEQIEDCPF